MNTVAIKLEGIAKQYVPPWQLGSLNRQQRSVKALTDVSLMIRQGEICGLLGVNGAGKTTLIKILATLILPDQGYGEINGIDLIRFPLQVKAQIGLVTTNDRSFYWRLSAWENLDFFAALYGVESKKKRERIGELLALVAMEEHAHKGFMTLSTGQRQRLAIARALLSDPAVMLFDEPTSGLDPVAAKKMRGFVEESLVRHQGKTVLWCTHNLHEAEQVCNRVVVLHQGRIVADLNHQEIRSRMDDLGTYRFALSHCDSQMLTNIGISPLIVQKEGERLVVTFRAAESMVPELIAQLTTGGVAIFHCSRCEEGLEELFPLIVAEEK